MKESIKTVYNVFCKYLNMTNWKKNRIFENFAVYKDIQACISQNNNKNKKPIRFQKLNFNLN